jgi:hypothetical protein
MTANDLPESGATHIVRASLKARLYRDIEIASTASLYDLGEAIVHSFEFDLDHAFGFFSKFSGNFYRSPVRYELLADTGFQSESGSVRRTAVRKAFPSVGAKMLFLFDYGDEWRFKVEVIGLGEKMPKTDYPRVVATVGTAPPQYPGAEDLDEE